MALFTAAWSIMSGAVITGIVFKIIQKFFQGKIMGIVVICIAGVLLWLFATFPTEMLDTLAGVFKKIIDWAARQFKI